MAEITVTVAGPVGCGKSAVAGEIEIALRAIGVPVRHADPKADRSEKNMTGADWQSYLEMYQPRVVLVEAITRARKTRFGALKRWLGAALSSHNGTKGAEVSETDAPDTIAGRFNLDANVIRAALDHLSLAINVALSASPPPSPERGWQPIETAPKDRSWILVYCSDDDSIDDFKWSRCSVAQWRTRGRTSNNGEGWYDDRIFSVRGASHWMPLSAAPLVADHQTGEKP